MCQLPNSIDVRNISDAVWFCSCSAVNMSTGTTQSTMLNIFMNTGDSAHSKSLEIINPVLLVFDIDVDHRLVVEREHTKR